ncbi:MAG: hypothetical protein M3O90_03580 [Actinomycetota bacterium]|nr:hypothetical protein [Actinomycetota bacterium]
MPRLKKRKSSRGSARLRVPAGASAGSYLLLACADSGRKVKEANERNNCRASRSCARVGSPDRDGDGTPNAADCAPDNAAIKPGAPDKPDLGFVDSNCDGIDGDQGRAVFVSPAGSDANPGTRAAPKQTVQAGIDAAAGTGAKDVYVAAGSYSGAALADDVGVFGGYDPSTWSRSLTAVSAISGAPQAALADGDTGVTLQLLTLHGTALPPTAQPYDPSV